MRTLCRVKTVARKKQVTTLLFIYLSFVKFNQFFLNQVCNFFKPFDHIHTSEVCNSLYTMIPVAKIANEPACNFDVYNFLITINRPAQNVQLVGLQSAIEVLAEALLPEQRASFMADLGKQHLWAYLPQPLLSMLCVPWAG